MKLIATNGWKARGKVKNTSAKSVGLPKSPSSHISRKIIGRAGIRRRNIVLAVFIFVFDCEIWIFNDANGFESPVSAGYDHRVTRGLQHFREASLIPDI